MLESEVDTLSKEQAALREDAEIYQAFDAYERDRQSASALADLGRVISPAAGSYADMGVNQASKYYEEIKASANIALAMRGCQPIQ